MSHEATPEQMSGPAPVTSSEKSPLVAFLLWFFLGGFGAHRFYFGKTGSAFGMIGLCIASVVLTAVVIGLVGFLALFVWWIIDAFKINGWCQGEDGVAGSIGTPGQSQAAA